MDKVNIKRLADELHLSIATVSRALRNSYQIRPETREKVWELARRLNYQPNPFASGLRGQKSKNIAVIFPELANNFFSLAIYGIEEVARQKGYQVLIFLTHESVVSEQNFIATLGNGRVDGVLISLSSETGNHGHIDTLNEQVPVVSFDRVSETGGLLQVSTNDYEVSYQGTRHLLEQGCKRIMYLQALKQLSVGKARLQGYLDALRDAELAVDEQMLLDCDDVGEDAYEIIRDAFLETSPDAVLSSVEKLGTTCYYVAKDLQWPIPDRLKVVSFSNLETAALLDPPMTTITQPAFDIGREAALLLFQQLEKKKTGAENKVIPSVLIPRGSSVQAAAGK